jgi:Na+-transporting methylmalonyl-CoA/oxaloacetate decarboxylase gamma subunit
MNSLSGFFLEHPLCMYIYGVFLVLLFASIAVLAIGMIARVVVKRKVAERDKVERSSPTAPEP